MSTPSAPVVSALITKVGSILAEHMTRITRTLGWYLILLVPARSAPV